jgi:uncharacterized coiled-coil DUF342 family protein
MTHMAVMAEYSTKVIELGEKARQLASWRDSLRAEVESLKERFTLLQLENEVNALQNEIDTLLKEKNELEEKLAALDQVEEPTLPAQAPNF